ncbi:hypothetical protein AKJ51_04540 [candidate division MSBL1 archaeon SCGC-AAA382A20]|uniref:Large ribosomal subunit protein eL19 n=1 Tax=candidate division MSBL1 archaeon SCGC-AAA382A20 TaxID=1698280 RepID=A0A133VHI9_9EURY|nr:hypothetical protein AKJ51_04540 [candidate division MSBL1 archaeon SCGC-AAA382A20]
MNLSTQKRMAADVLNCGKNKIWIDPKRQEDVDDAITKADIRRLIQEGAIDKKRGQEQSKGKAKERRKQKAKGRRKGQGSRKGKEGSRQSKKEKWMSKIRSQRSFLKKLKNENKIGRTEYRNLYKKIKGNYFNSKKQLREYIKKEGLLKEGEEID